MCSGSVRGIKKVIRTPHDRVFKWFLAQPAVIRDFMQLHLPPEVLAECDLSTLKLESESFIANDLRACFSDVHYSLKTRNGKSDICVLIEHQSSADKYMPFRILRYALAAIQRHLDAGYKKLPVVIPVLFYAGKRKSYPCSVRAWPIRRHC